VPLFRPLPKAASACGFRVSIDGMTRRGYDRPNPSTAMNRLRRLTGAFLTSFLVVSLHMGTTVGALAAFAWALMAYGVLAGLLTLCLVVSIEIVLMVWICENF
jgi:uncharacterized membrane protein (DUF485 family)